MELTELTIKQIAGFADTPAIFQQGLACFEAKAVQPIGRWRKEIAARVKDDRNLYTVEIRPIEDNLSAHCSCAYPGRVCHHIVAVLLYAISEQPNEDELEYISQIEVTPTALQEALSRMDREELFDLIVGLADNSSEVRQLLLSYVKIAPEIIQGQPRDEVTVKDMKAEIKEYFDSIQRKVDAEEDDEYEEGYYDEYYDDDDYDDEDEEEIPDLSSLFQTAKILHPHDQLEVFWYVVTCGYDYFTQHGSIIGTDGMSKALKLFAEAVLSLNLDLPDKLIYINSLIAALDWKLMEYDDLDVAIKEAIDILCTTPEECYYTIQTLQKTDEEKNADWLVEYYLKLEDEESYIKVREANLKRPYQYLELAEYWQKKGEVEREIATLERWICDRKTNAMEETYMDGNDVTTLLSRLVDYYQERGDRENLCRVLIVMVDEHGLSLMLYKQVEEVAKSLDRWENSRQQLLELAGNDYKALGEIYLYEKDWEAAIALAQNPHCNRTIQLAIAKGVKHHHPQAAIAIYQKWMQQSIDEGNRSSYRHAARYAEKIKSIYLSVLNDPTGWQHYIDNLRQQYPRHSALKDEFKHL